VVADPRSFPQCPIAICRGPGTEEIVNEHDAVGDHAVVTDAYQLTNEAMRLDFGPLTNPNAALDFDKWTNETFITQVAAVQVRRFNDGHPFAENNLVDTAKPAPGKRHV
jgi:hypothetical protein